MQYIHEDGWRTDKLGCGDKNNRNEDTGLNNV